MEPKEIVKAFIERARLAAEVEQAAAASESAAAMERVRAAIPAELLQQYSWQQVGDHLDCGKVSVYYSHNTDGIMVWYEGKNVAATPEAIALALYVRDMDESCVVARDCLADALENWDGEIDKRTSLAVILDMQEQLRRIAAKRAAHDEARQAHDEAVRAWKEYQP